MTDVTILTASIPGRAEDLHRAVLSVAAQTLPPRRHLIGIDIERRGGPATYNQLLDAVDTEWFCCLDDDDLLDPTHLEVLAAAVGDTVDVAYSWCRTEGRPFSLYNHPFSAESLCNGGSPVPVTALARTVLARKVGGFPATSSYDRDLWRNIHLAGGIIVHVPEVTWTYRLCGPNLSWGEL